MSSGATLKFFKDYGCTDGGCVFGHPGGQHTNGGCHCLAYNYVRDTEARWRAMKGVRALRDRIAALEDANTRLKDAEKMFLREQSRMAKALTCAERELRDLRAAVGV